MIQGTNEIEKNMYRGKFMERRIWGNFNFQLKKCQNSSPHTEERYWLLDLNVNGPFLFSRTIGGSSMSWMARLLVWW